MLLVLDREGDVAARDLAAVATLSPSAASYHLRTMVDTGAVVARRQGRIVLYRLASPEIGATLRSLVGGSARRDPAPDPPERFARTCYHHLGGRLAVAMMDSMRRARWLGDGIEGPRLTVPGARAMRELGVDFGANRNDVRPVVRPCMDRTERRPHVGGRLGIGLRDRLFRLGWIERVPDSRAVAVTPSGARGFADVFGIQVPVPPGLGFDGSPGTT
jgi:DNA-binding transcriptional ArsR family regulator